MQCIYFLTIQTKQVNIIVLANGLFPTEPRILNQLFDADRVVCCDGALQKYMAWYRNQQQHPRHTVAVVGDGDSLKAETLREAQALGIEVVREVVSEQESNDLSKAVRFAMEHGAWSMEHGLPQDGSRPNSQFSILNSQLTQVCILGATGLREDHTLGNISLLAHYMQCYPNIDFSMTSDYGTLYPMQGHRTFQSKRGQQVSLFSLTPQIPVSVQGLKYPIRNRCLHSWWEGTLNEALGEKFEISGGTMIVEIIHL